jgi:hypothetical protein
VHLIECHVTQKYDLEVESGTQTSDNHVNKIDFISVTNYIMLVMFAVFISVRVP